MAEPLRFLVEIFPLLFGAGVALLCISRGWRLRTGNLAISALATGAAWATVNGEFTIGAAPLAIVLDSGAVLLGWLAGRVLATNSRLPQEDQSRG